MWERNIDQLPLIHTPTGDQTYNLAICRNQARELSVYGIMIQPTEPHQPGPFQTSYKHLKPAQFTQKLRFLISLENRKICSPNPDLYRATINRSGAATWILQFPIAPIVPYHLLSSHLVISLPGPSRQLGIKLLILKALSSININKVWCVEKLFITYRWWS